MTTISYLNTALTKPGDAIELVDADIPRIETIIVSGTKILAVTAANKKLMLAKSFTNIAGFFAIPPVENQILLDGYEKKFTLDGGNRGDTVSLIFVMASGMFEMSGHRLRQQSKMMFGNCCLQLFNCAAEGSKSRSALREE
jgi:hypothetical protein